MTDDVSVRFTNVSKRFRATEAIRDLTLSVPRGSVFGLLGRNGAGKSTALRCLVGLERLDGGAITVLGREPLSLDVSMRQRIGYLSEDGVPFPAATAEQMIRLCAPLYPAWSRALEQQVLSRFQIDPRRKLRDLSLGQRRAMALMLAVCPQPELLILDEPAANLDAVVRREFLETVLTLVGDANSTVIFSSHILSDVERVADRVAILHHGQLLIERALDDLKEQVCRLRLLFDGASPAHVAVPGLLALRRAPREMLATVIDYDREAIDRLAETLGARVEIQTLNLEELFIDLVGDGDRPDWVAA
jgi:ABC-type multidrug transport system ATPase subunit